MIADEKMIRTGLRPNKKNSQENSRKVQKKYNKEKI